MQTIKKGQLFQYTLEHHGKYYPQLPGLPFSEEYNKFETVWKSRGITPWFEKREMAKYTLFAVRVKPVYHPMAKTLRCDYVLCYISNPQQNGETKEGWVQSNWIEPLTKFETYDAEELSTAHNVFNEIKKRRKEIPERELTLLEFFRQKIKGRKR